jgi:hypothetical protein
MECTVSSLDEHGQLVVTMGNVGTARLFGASYHLYLQGRIQGK